MPSTLRSSAIIGLFLCGITDARGEPTRVSYGISLAGLPVGSGTLVIDDRSGATRYRADVSVGGILGLGRFTTLARVVHADAPRVAVRTRWSAALGSGDASSELNPLARVAGGGTSRYSAQSKSSSGSSLYDVRFDKQSATVERQEAVEKEGVKRSPINDSHRRGVINPLSILIDLAAVSTEHDLDQFCRQRRSVFTGQSRFDLEGRGLDPVADASEPTLRCRMHYVPVAGHRIDPAAAKAEPRSFAIDFVRRDNAPWLPARIAFPSVYGAVTATMQTVEDAPENVTKSMDRLE